MKNSKKIMTALLAVSVLAACGQKEEEQKAEPVEQQEAVIDVSAEAEQFKSLLAGEMDSFVTDTELLATAINEGKLEDAQKLYPLVTMYYERLQPLAPSFQELDKKINGDIVEGKETDTTGFQRIAHGLFDEKKTAGYEEIAEELVADVKSLQTDFATIDVSEINVLASAVTMFQDMANNRLTSPGIAGNEVYAVKAQTDVAEDLMEVFVPRVSTESADAALKAITKLNDIVAYYEVGKEDYVNYNLFTTKQEQELITAVTNVEAALQQMNESIK
ncbi:iron uptake system component EfeO [Solibacillus kalamii]|uniref:Iron uptake system component EfeO n=1 Tax=Solibacillus kalamii TaxID=1748298 RepID=A0ABX3ZLR9_9BACL|nr:EfeM/EfeO family lipoprotein [Solibacillus kalamii]MBM7664946.1 iron uptake system component EfeO [Solibacillus kalamii]OUZ40685.1 iron uptake system component EfeO precursor [Solibacillus kalamii]